VRGVPAEMEEAYSRRRSFCCGREECRKRVTPPSVRFLGRRVYVAAVVLLCSAQKVCSKKESLKAPRRTIRRWVRWFRESMTGSCFWQIRRGRLMPPVREEELPQSLLERFTGVVSERICAALRFLSPLGTSEDLSSFSGRMF
jgi:hypothetical protein